MLGWSYLTDGAKATFVVTALTTALFVLYWVVAYGLPRGPSSGVAVSAKFLELERGRVLGAAKGIATSAVGFLTVLVTAYLDTKPRDSVPDIFLYAYVFGAVGSVALAAVMNAQTRDFIADIR